MCVCVCMLVFSGVLSQWVEVILIIVFHNFCREELLELKVWYIDKLPSDYRQDHNILFCN